MKNISYGEREIERENSLWRITINRFYQLEDLEALIDLRDGPECLDNEIIEMINSYIRDLENRQKGRSHTE